ncbi:GNAT family N-acetyltransferase [Rossellomorea marisflavi]|uniref:GNAT family N-acetyltransferase n=1 Tax=Rossellomorea marisflavi TaxID=189381 RepID=UPI00064F396D|nr:GNAT family N-acetyltransferase [Rossellomorea marisflavi]KMK95058.1 acetyltransferase [Rossellomorea marisflavi]
MNRPFTLDCGDILLREFQPSDAESIYHLTSQPEVYEFLPDWRSTREQRLDWLTNYEVPDNEAFLSSLPTIGNGWLKLGIIEKETGAFIGFCNTGIKEELPEPNREIAFAISKHYRNKGYTTTAVKGLIAFLVEQTDVKQLNAVVLPRNHASRRVIEKNGFRFCGNVEIDGEVHGHYTVAT